MKEPEGLQCKYPLELVGEGIWHECHEGVLTIRTCRSGVWQTLDHYIFYRCQLRTPATSAEACYYVHQLDNSPVSYGGFLTTRCAGESSVCWVATRKAPQKTLRRSTDSAAAAAGSDQPCVGVVRRSAVS